MSREFIKGLRLSELFFTEAVKPILDENFPGLGYSAARLGSGSDVLGFDTPRSTDHGWGPRLELFLSPEDFENKGESIRTVLSEKLPYSIHGYSTHFSNAVIGNGWMVEIDSGPVTHGVTVETVDAFVDGYLGADPRKGLEPADWLIMPEQRLRTVTAGQVHYDGLGELEPIRKSLNYYPHDVWLYLLAAQWRRIDQEEPFMGRTGDVGDEIGSHVIAARLVRDLMRLCFLMERQYAPYIKWFGTAFAQLKCAPTLTPTLEDALNGHSWKEREEHLSAAYEYVAQLHNALGITPPLSTKVSPFHDRPYLVIHSGDFVEAIRAAITDDVVRRLPPYLGSVDQCSDSTDVLSDPVQTRKLKAMYQ